MKLLFVIFIKGSNNDEETSEQSSYPNDARLCEQYLDLMCRYDRENVLNFVRDCKVIRTKQALDVSSFTNFVFVYLKFLTLIILL